MPRGIRKLKPGKVATFWMPSEEDPTPWKRDLRRTWDEIENKSAFIQMALRQAPSIMAWAILQDMDDKKFPTPNHPPDTLEVFNERFPLDKLTAKRKQLSHKNSQNLPDVLL